MRKTYIGGFVFALTVAGLATARMAAVTCPNAGPWCIDGTIADSGSGIAITDPNGSVQELGPINSSTTKIGVIDTASVPMLGYTSVPAKVDLNTVYLATKKDGTGDVWLYFAWLRDATTGSGFVSLEIDKAKSDCDYSSDTTLLQCNPWKNRAAGDFLISWDQQGNSHDIYLREFDGNHWITPPTCAPANQTPLGCLLNQSSAAAEYNSDFSGGELALNLVDNGIVTAGACQSFNNVIPGTVTGNSDTADYKDVVLKPLSIVTCGKITVEKVTQNPAGSVFTDATSTFHYAITGGPGYGSNIKAGAANKVTHENVPSGSYSIVEDTVATGYSKISIKCDGVNADGVNFTVTDGATTACVITNRQNAYQPLASTTQAVYLRDTMNISNILRLTGDFDTDFKVDFRLYESSAACTADLSRTAGTPYLGKAVTFTPSSGTSPYVATGFAESHAQGTGVLKGSGTYYWWAKFSGNKIGGLEINKPVEKSCTESTAITVVE